jgi:ABC-type spermidine/putrescine transport system permease subunit II
MATINNPFGAAGTLTIAATGTTAATISNNETVVTSLTTLTGNATLDLTLSSELKVGASLHIKVKTTGTETFTFGTGIDGPVVTGVAGKTWTQSFWYDGTIFLPCGAKIQID